MIKSQSKKGGGGGLAPNTSEPWCYNGDAPTLLTVKISPGRRSVNETVSGCQKRSEPISVPPHLLKEGKFFRSFTRISAKNGYLP